MTVLAAELEAYRRSMEAFAWDTPPTFNFARDVVDRFAVNPERPAILYRDVRGIETQITYGRMSEWIHRAGHRYSERLVSPTSEILDRRHESRSHHRDKP